MKYWLVKNPWELNEEGKDTSECIEMFLLRKALV
ncbi:unnamed protein product [Linum tenue]|uniref:Uncharacterized protein n=1 Tax=Linum tenue TaxID=586396 RepID=A0AAV0HZR8_9ROSI|nr:unnamed protein product [Linum tenue]